MTGATGNIYCGLHEFADMAFFVHLLRDDDLFVDVGANIGSYTVLAAAVAGAHAICVEPDSGTAQSLRRNIEINKLQHRVEVVEAALGASSGTVRFTLGLDTENRVASSSEGGLVTAVPLRTLDEVVGLRQPLAIKLDVEGFEEQVLLGATTTLALPSLLAVESENSSPAVNECLAAHGFLRAFYNPFSRALEDRPSLPSANALFIRERKFIADRLKSALRIEVYGHKF